MNVWTEASGTIVPYILGICLGGLVFSGPCGIVSLFASRRLAKRGAISKYHENKIGSLGFSAGFVLGALIGFIYVWRS